MKKLKYEILFIILFMTVGIAAVSSNLLINVSTPIASNPDDFSVYFSNVLVDGTQDLSLVQSETSLVFTGEFSAVGDKKEITYDVTNASVNYDADIDISCTQSTTYLTISNSFDTDNYLSATSTRSGVLTITLSKSYTGTDITQDISCTISASAVERASQGSGSVATPIEKKISIGDEISIGEEKFNIISIEQDTVTMLAQYNLGTDYIQSTTGNSVTFSDRTGWNYDPGPQEIDIQTWSTNPKTYVNEYVAFLQSEIGDTTLSGDLITATELGELGCSITSDYSNYSFSGSDLNLSCVDSSYSDWLLNGQAWWTKSAVSGNNIYFTWVVNFDGSLSSSRVLSQVMGTVTIPAGSFGVRPVITISKETALALMKYKTYVIGEEISIAEEKFNVISQTPFSVSMLAQYGISGTSNRQKNENSPLIFSYEFGWEYKPGPKEIDIQIWSPNIANRLNNYLDYLRETTDDSGVEGDLISLLELEKLGCTIDPDYNGDNGGSCTGSIYANWLVNGHNWWTRSADSSFDRRIWRVKSNGDFSAADYEGDSGSGEVRPVITISKETLSLK